MTDLFNPADPLEASYQRIYEALGELREGFHRSGRLDDSNAKLDEVAKLFATCLASKTGQIEGFPTAHSANLIQELQAAFGATIKLPQYHLRSGGSIFGENASLVLRAGDEQLAAELVTLVTNCVQLAFDLRDAGRPFDILNEAFGHFIRDNFRGNVEDAQYMTPPEVVDFMADIALRDIEQHEATRGAQRHWTILDPSCGVGSFLAAIYNRARDSEWLSPERLRLFGQDKVERMVRLSTINLELFDVEEHHVTVGNSLELGSPIDELNGLVDFILTNPPFGARFNPTYVSQAFGSNTPFFSRLNKTGSATFDSELLFIDRNLRLLREGGRLLIVIPDGVVSAKGLAAMLRQHLASVVTVKAIVELPAVTFAQAGTRTKTAVLYLQKGRTPEQQNRVFLAVSKDLGFQVSSRKGVQMKILEGKNDLPAIFTAYQTFGQNTVEDDVSVILSNPSCVAAPESAVLRSSWTPNHYSAARFETVAAIRRENVFDLVPLAELVDFCADSRRNIGWKEGWAYISVLHILGEGFVDIGGALSYSPKTPGVPVEPGELLISRINPRIPRTCVTPDFGVKTLCSTEFEVMRPKDRAFDTYALAYLLQTGVVQKQIQSLTSGTSASHNRIRTSELAQVLIPLPREGTGRGTEIAELIVEYRTAIQAMAGGAAQLAKIRSLDNSMFGN